MYGGFFTKSPIFKNFLNSVISKKVFFKEILKGNFFLNYVFKIENFLIFF